MKICYFADANNYHTQKWVRYFSSKGNEVHVLSLTEYHGLDKGCGNTRYYWLCNKGDKNGSDFQKLSYLATVKTAKRILNEIEPDIVHAHYASSYGLVCALCCDASYYLSVWGKDVYDFPRRSVLHKMALKFSLAKASAILSTSRAMAQETSKYTEKNIQITPFGVDMHLFHPNQRSGSKDHVVIGTVKALEKKYGIDVLLKAVKIVTKFRPEACLELRIAGKGSEEKNLKALCRDLGLEEMTTWLGFISQADAAKEWADFDIAVIPSVDESESFGVSAVEAQASSCALIVSDIPGLLEACCDGATAVTVPKNAPESLARAICSLIDDPQERLRLGHAGRKYVESEYELNECFMRVRHLYEAGLAGVSSQR